MKTSVIMFHLLAWQRVRTFGRWVSLLGHTHDWRFTEAFGPRYSNYRCVHCGGETTGPTPEHERLLYELRQRKGK